MIFGCVDIHVSADVVIFHCFQIYIRTGAGQADRVGAPGQGVTQPLPYTAISRKVVGKHGHATTPKSNMGYDQYTLPNDCSCRTYFCCFPLALANICPWPLVPFFQISLENRADKTTHNTFRDFCVHFFRQPLSKQLYTTDVILLQPPLLFSCAN